MTNSFSTEFLDKAATSAVAHDSFAVASCARAYRSPTAAAMK
jgi:hypothetical protein